MLLVYALVALGRNRLSRMLLFSHPSAETYHTAANICPRLRLQAQQ